MDEYIPPDIMAELRRALDGPPKVGPIEWPKMVYEWVEDIPPWYIRLWRWLRGMSR